MGFVLYANDRPGGPDEFYEVPVAPDGDGKGAQPESSSLGKC